MKTSMETNQPKCLQAALRVLVWSDLRWKDEFVEREETGLISTLKYREENGSVKEVCFCLGFVWLISEVDALVKNQG